MSVGHWQGTLEVEGVYVVRHKLKFLVKLYCLWCENMVPCDVSAEVLYPSRSQDRNLLLGSRSYLPAKFLRKENHGRPCAIDLMSSKQGIRNTGNLKNNDFFEVSTLLGCYTTHVCSCSSKFQNSLSVPFSRSKIAWPLKMGLTGYPETSVNKYLTCTS